jgi:hypothetical protein
MLCLLYNSLESAEAACEQIWVNILRRVPLDCPCYDGYLFNCIQMSKVEYDVLTDEDLKSINDELRTYPKFGLIKGEPNKEFGFTTRWAVPKEIELGEYAGKYFIKKPDETLMTSVTSDYEVEYSRDWFNTETI